MNKGGLSRRATARRASPRNARAAVRAGRTSGTGSAASAVHTTGTRPTTGSGCTSGTRPTARARCTTCLHMASTRAARLRAGGSSLPVAQNGRRHAKRHERRNCLVCTGDDCAHDALSTNAVVWSVGDRPGAGSRPGASSRRNASVTAAAPVVGPTPVAGPDQ